MKLFLAAIVSSIVALPLPAQAGEVKLQIVNGLVTLQARDATVREILNEWARVGQVKIVNADKISGVPVTLDLQSVPEGQALNTVLRSVSGYVAAPRTMATANPGTSVYDSIIVMAAPRSAATTTFAGPAAPQPQPQYPFRGGPPPGMGAAQFDDQDQPVGAPPVYPGGAPGGVQRGIATQGQPGLSTSPMPNQLPAGAPGTVSPMPTAQPGQPGQGPAQPGLGPAGTLSTPVRRPGGPGGPGGEGGTE